MIMLNHLSAFAERTFTASTPRRTRYAVSLIDRCTGKPHHIAGIPLILMTPDPFETSRDLMRNRDPERWDTSVKRIDRQGGLS
ncbi:hypothetical protein RGQ15_07980 [Paracoccus sp. MBLB3053]|uniref:Uncharacterized protein n=1 Tax=Paracoccus aurantius TaxID=3073814 RepID=A0ABU2HR55_9RHOB|nr:hypothetical protein [Paracoccus sp. MBLB3053]MDS9467512.1 hypothetical protein [Paracoccus sp. MBLB3053]